MQIKANTPTKEWHVIITVATAKDKTTAKDNTGAGDELLKNGQTEKGMQHQQ